ncbi:MAG: HIT domain-containing protein [Thermoflexus sp.]|nr:HIT domain-containing protein [Thermoflexus sp.]
MERLWTPWRMAYLKGEGGVPQGCIFCLKIDGSDEAEHILFRGQTAYVTLNRYPYNNGHLMVIPYAHVPSLEDLDDPTLLETMQLVTLSLRVLRQAYRPEGFNIGVNIGRSAGAGVADHVHLHIVPRWTGDTNFMPVISNTRVLPEWLDDTYRRLRPLFEALVNPSLT